MTPKAYQIVSGYLPYVMLRAGSRLLGVLWPAFLFITLQGQTTVLTGEAGMPPGDTIQLNIAPIEGFFSVEDPLLITLAFDIRGFQRTKDEPEDFQATITIMTSDSDSVTQEISLKARGYSRIRICDLPPIMLNLKSMGEQVPGLDDPGKLKLVTYCKPSSLYENYVLKEYLVYKMYNLLTPYSYRARLVRVNYVDINRPNKPYTAYGFIIEDLDDVAERNNAVEIDNPNLSYDDMIPEFMLRLFLFQYMIGNTDWAVPSLHNIKLLKSLDMLTDKAIPVPYDFDFSGFVFTDYAKPAPGLQDRIMEVTERYYMGSCPEEETLNAAIDEFEKLREKFMEILVDFPYSSSGSHKQTEKYIESFFKLCERRNVLVNSIKNDCPFNQ